MVAATLLPTGMTLAGLQVYENMRAVDYLLTRPEVDGARIGVTGNSGGGTQTSLMMLVDPRIAAAAMDQRGSLKKSLAKERGADVGDREMEEFKILVTEVLTQHASAILLDPEWGIPASKRRAKNAGLLMAYEKTGYDKTGPGRLGDLLDLWSVRRLKEAGADCIKILLYYTPDDPKSVNDVKHAWVERIGDECRANDIPFFLEFVGYEEGIDEKGLEYAMKKPEGSMPSCPRTLRVPAGWSFAKFSYRTRIGRIPLCSKKASQEASSTRICWYSSGRELNQSALTTSGMARTVSSKRLLPASSCRAVRSNSSRRLCRSSSVTCRGRSSGTHC